MTNINLDIVFNINTTRIRAHHHTVVYDYGLVDAIPIILIGSEGNEFILIVWEAVQLDTLLSTTQVHTCVTQVNVTVFWVYQRFLEHLSAQDEVSLNFLRMFSVMSILRNTLTVGCVIARKWRRISGKSSQAWRKTFKHLPDQRISPPLAFRQSNTGR